MRALTLEEALGRVVPFSQAAQALADGFAQALDIGLIPGALTARERELATQLRQSRYAAPGWTARA
jgi:hypothetical protein